MNTLKAKREIEYIVNDFVDEIQGLRDVIDEKDREISRKDDEILELQEQIESLEADIDNFKNKP